MAWQPQPNPFEITIRCIGCKRTWPTSLDFDNKPVFPKNWGTVIGRGPKNDVMNSEILGHICPGCRDCVLGNTPEGK